MSVPANPVAATAAGQAGSNDTFQAAAGLANVSVASTRVSDVLGRLGFYHYRGYNAVDLARRGSFEDAWYLMLNGELPAPDERASFARETAALRNLPEGVAELPPARAPLSHPGSLQPLRAAVSRAAPA